MSSRPYGILVRINPDGTAVVLTGDRQLVTVPYASLAKLEPPAPPAGAPPPIHLQLPTATFPLLIQAQPAVALAPTPTTAPLAPPPTRPGVLVPLYIYPTDPAWTTLIGLKAKYTTPMMAVFNPASGPGAAISIDYVNGVTRLKTAGITTLGYVHTSYGVRPLADVEAEILEYWNWYKPDGVFFDEMSSQPGGEAYIGSLTTYAKSLGMKLTVGNPGVPPPQTYINTVDILTIYEGAGIPPIIALQQYPAYKTAYLAYGVPTLDVPTLVATAQYAAWIYITSDVPPNPWDTLPGYLEVVIGTLMPLTLPGAPVSTATLPTTTITPIPAPTTPFKAGDKVIWNGLAATVVSAVTGTTLYIIFVPSLNSEYQVPVDQLTLATLTTTGTVTPITPP